MRISPEYVATLRYMLKAAESQLAAFKSGEKYVRMEEEFRKQLREKDTIIKGLQQELACSRRETVTVRNQWFAIFEDMQKESDLQEKNTRKKSKA